MQVPWPLCGDLCAQGLGTLRLPKESQEPESHVKAFSTPPEKPRCCEVSCERGSPAGLCIPLPVQLHQLLLATPCKCPTGKGSKTKRALQK